METPRPRVLQICDYHGPYKGNFLPSLEAARAELMTLGGVQVVAFTDVAQRTDWFSDFTGENTVALIPQGASLLQQVNIIARLVEQHRINIIHSHFSKYDLACVAASQLTRVRSRQVEVLWHVHSPSPRKTGISASLKDLFRWRLLGTYPRTVHVSRGGQLTMTERGLQQRRSVVLENGMVTQSGFHPTNFYPGQLIESEVF